ncbi:MAG: isopentenyl-diphosphate Delta-isomerase [Candidatus Micrarchaeota archaeon]|nr:isopentenyl-diphosphate Delta-isomerase [Candidatus Micrarchaeota archaeon]MDE1834348.1 isopentenyl-diphosphate Delta-isomerase [Candidatus Micrarchaeota archaeon]MDE1860034.1 isopentenyl-diphosphate Delta-isomerase [Candidatus Micrarchaeota archaeon]
MEQVVLVDHNDNEIGLEEKLKAHQNGGKLHRAISIFIFNNKGETMLQQRAAAKYHGGGLWSNTVCSHPRKGEDTLQAAHRRLKEEMGFDCEMKETFAFEYEADMGNGLTEHEYDHVLFGRYEKEPKPNPEEVQAWKWVSLQELKQLLAKNPKMFTPWVRIAVGNVIEKYKEYSK